MKVLLDTNFLLDIFRFKIPTDELKLHDLYTIRPVVREIEKISRSRSKESVYARLALKFLEKINVIECEGDADAIIEKISKGFVVATNDRELRNKLKHKNVKTIYIKAKKEIEMVE